MAIRSIVESDLSGKPDAATAVFGLGGTWYEVDLTPEERKKLEQALEPYLKVGRKADKKPTKKQVVPETTAEEREEIRKWAKKKGLEFAERGRIPKTVQKAYDEAHKIDRSNQR
ncbi:Lsr2 family protein [Streptomyces sp. NBC_00987]|uniref:histone-like nucleoid-structuring protein Lsr2 n=1 Tax=Streptomyces sp. NBC_00987 TaxID=2903703 RepID=UPI0038688F06|nr:Lsr2 family protein [Streptomyces sp. NBC_00987]